MNLLPNFLSGINLLWSPSIFVYYDDFLPSRKINPWGSFWNVNLPTNIHRASGCGENLWQPRIRAPYLCIKTSTNWSIARTESLCIKRSVWTVGISVRARGYPCNGSTVNPNERRRPLGALISSQKIWLKREYMIPIIWFGYSCGGLG